MPKRNSEEPPDVSIGSAPHSHKKVRGGDTLGGTKLLNERSAVNGDQVVTTLALTTSNGNQKKSRPAPEHNEHSQGEHADEDIGPSVLPTLLQTAPIEGYSDLYLDTINRSP